MIIEDYHNIIGEIVEIDTDANSIAESRRLINEINERESILLKLKENIIKDIRMEESKYLKNKAAIREKYSTNEKSGISRMIMGSPKNKLIKELKTLESEYNTNISEFKDLRYIIEDLLVQFNDLKSPLNNSMRARFGN
jgi:hypothetical protein